MASRRMFSRRITDSSRFVRMPLSAQALYFHLGQHADDDGVVESYPVMKMIGANEDDLRMLILKEFVIPLNNDYVSYLPDWVEHNKIRADRKEDSLYIDLLLQVVPDAEIRRAKPSYYSNQKSICLTNDGQMTDKRQTNVRIGKDSIGKDSIRNAAVLCLDDIGVQMSKEWVDTVFYSLINERYSNHKITIYTSNALPDALKIDDRIIDRIASRSYIITLPEVNVRRSKAEAGMKKLLDK